MMKSKKKVSGVFKIILKLSLDITEKKIKGQKAVKEVATSPQFGTFTRDFEVDNEKQKKVGPWKLINKFWGVKHI